MMQAAESASASEAWSAELAPSPETRSTPVWGASPSAESASPSEAWSAELAPSLETRSAAVWDASASAESASASGASSAELARSPELLPLEPPELDPELRLPPLLLLEFVAPELLDGELPLDPKLPPPSAAALCSTSGVS